MTSFTEANQNQQFYYDICNAANIPWKTLNNKPLNAVLEKYCGRKVPEESTLRKTYLLQLYNNVSIIFFVNWIQIAGH